MNLFEFFLHVRSDKYPQYKHFCHLGFVWGFVVQAVEYVESGMVLGLGTGSTAAFVVAKIGQLLKVPLISYFSSLCL